jgi:hypothetical protein
MKTNLTLQDFLPLKKAKMDILGTKDVRLLRVRANPDLGYTGFFPWFDIVTWGSYLTITGGYGTFTFSQMFPMSSFHTPMAMSIEYSLRKLMPSAKSHCYDDEGALLQIKESIMYSNDLSKDDDNELTQALADLLSELEGLLGGDMTGGEASMVLDRYLEDYEGPLEISEDLVSGIEWMQPSHQVVWCIWAIHWAIREHLRLTDPTWPAQEIAHLAKHFFPGASKVSDTEYTYAGGSLCTAPSGVSWTRDGQESELIQTPQELSARMVELGMPVPKQY